MRRRSSASPTLRAGACISLNGRPVGALDRLLTEDYCLSEPPGGILPLEFHVLGTLRVVAHSRPVPLGGRKQRALLALLLIERDCVVAVDRLVDALWGDTPPQSARNGVQVYVSRLRRALQEEGDARGTPLVSHPDGYVLHVPPDAVDSTRFERLLAAATEALRGGDPAAAQRLLDGALTLWRGPPLADFRFDTFAQAEIARLEELRLSAQAARAESMLALGRPGEAIGDLQALVAEHPFEERLHEQLMRALYGAGRQTDALAVYRDFRRRLVRESGLEPCDELRRLEIQILRHDLGRDERPMDARDRSPASDERKMVTILVASLRHPLTGARDPEEVRARVVPLRQTVRREVERLGGAVVALVGDSVTAVFGAPAAHEDDPERAIRAALALRDLARGDGTSVRVGIATGEAIVAPEPEADGMVYGDVVVAAAALEAAAPAGAVLLDRRTSDAIHASRTGSWPEGVITASPQRAARQPAPFLGRAHELEALLDALRRVRDTRTPELVTVMGPPGIGKSRLIDEARNATGDDGAFRWLRGRSLPYGDGISSWALTELVKSHAGIEDADPADASGAKLRAAVQELFDSGEREWIVTHLRPLLGLGEDSTAGGSAGEAGAARRRFFEALAAVQPLVLVFEDAHWADDSVLDFVEGLVEWVQSAPLLVVLTARAELFERRPAWSARLATASMLRLGPLPAAETEQLVARLFDISALGAVERTALLAGIGGNPLYAEQFALMLRDDGHAPRPSVPDGVRRAIAARLDRLPATEKRVLQNAAILGPTFRVDGLAELVDAGPIAVEGLLASLAQREFVEPVEAEPAGDGRYRFRHVLVRDVAYDQIPHARRAERHERVAASLEAHGRHEDLAELLAYHYGGALAYGDSQRRHDLLPKAREAYAAAGARAAGLHAWPLAAAHYDRALELTSGGDLRRPGLELSSGAALLRQDYARGTERLESALAGLLASNDDERAAEAAALLGDAAWYAGFRDRCFAYLDRAVELVRGRPPTPAQAHVLHETARHRLLAGDARTAVAIGGEALAIARHLSLPDVEAHALVTVGTARGVAEDLAGVAEVERGLELALANGFLSAAARAYHNLFVLTGRFADPRDRRRERQLRGDALAIAEQLGDRQFIRFHETWLIQADYDDGKWDEAAREADAFLADSARDHHANEVVARMVRAEIRHARDDVGGALEDVDRALIRAREAKAPQYLFTTLATSARMYFDLDRTAEAGRLLDELLAEAAADAMREANAALVAVDLGRHDDLRDTIRTFPRDAFTPWRRALADGRLTDAAELAARREYPVIEAHVRLRAARAAIEQGRRREAEEELSRCCDFFARVGANRYLRLADDLHGGS